MYFCYLSLKYSTKIYKKKIFSMRVFWVLTISLEGYKGLVQTEASKNTLLSKKLAAKITTHTASIPYIINVVVFRWRQSQNQKKCLIKFINIYALCLNCLSTIGSMKITTFSTLYSETNITHSHNSYMYKFDFYIRLIIF